MQHRILFGALSAATLLLLTSCGSSQSNALSPTGSSSSTNPGHADPRMGGMVMPAGDGLSASLHGYHLTTVGAAMPNTAMPITFTVTRAGKPVTEFDVEQTKLMHFYLIRADLTGFQHLHPLLGSDGVWTVTPDALRSGRYRMYVQFVPHADAQAGALVLSSAFTVSGGAPANTPIPAPTTATSVDGYTVKLAGTPHAGKDTMLTLTVTRDGKPITDLQPYLDTYAHVTALHQSDLAFAHLHPAGAVNGDHGGPTLSLTADLPETGLYRFFIQFQTVGTLHTAAMTVEAS
jgi:hypothetical protein